MDDDLLTNTRASSEGRFRKLIRITYDFTSDHGGSFTCASAIDEYLFNKYGVHTDIIASRVTTKPPFFYNIIKGRMFGGSYGFSLSTLPKLLSIFKHQPDAVMVIDGLWMFHGIIGSICHILGFRVVQFVHGHLDPYYDSNFSKTFLKKIYWFFIESSNLTNRSAVFFTTKREYEKALPWISGKKINHFIQPLGVPYNDINLLSDRESISVEDIVTNESFNLSNNAFYLSLGRIHHKKGLDVLVQAYLLASNLTLDLRPLVICGPIEDQKLFDYLQEFILQENLQGRIIIIPPVYDTKSKLSLLSHAYFFLLCTRGENYGMVVPESCSMKTPILTTDKCDLYDNILEYNAGFIAPCDSREFASKILQTHELSPAQHVELMHSAYLLYMNKYSIATAAELFFTHINSL